MPDNNNNCPCEAVREMKMIVEKHDKQLSEGNTTFALIQQDLGYIKAQIDRKNRFNSSIVTSIVNVILTILLGYIAVKLGIQ